MFRLLFLALIPGAALAQDCAISIGEAGAISPAGRDWDLSTSGPWAWSRSGLAGARCGTDDGFWLGVDAAPGLRHSYSSTGGRGPLLMTTSVGWPWTANRSALQGGGMLITNRAARGGGVWIRNDMRLAGHRSAVTWKVFYLRGLNPTYGSSLTVDLGRWAFDDTNGMLVGPWHVRFGFETGTVTAFRFEVSEALKDEYAMHDVGVRVGMLHNLRAGAPLQPIGLVFWDIPLDVMGDVQVELNAGPTLRKGEVAPIAGANLRVQGVETPLQAWAGMLVGHDDGLYSSLDVGMGLVW